MNRPVMICALLAMTCALTFGAAIDGKWTVDVQGPNGTVTETLRLESDGSKLTGNLSGGRGGGVAITEGKIDGMNVSFKVVRVGRDGVNQTSVYSGTLSGDDLKLTVSREGGRGRGRGKGRRELAFKRVK